LIVKPVASEHPGGKLTRAGNTTFFVWKYRNSQAFTQTLSLSVTKAADLRQGEMKCP
jgi:hypothetical protein